MVIFSAVLLTIGSVSAQQAFAVEGQGTLYATEPFRQELWTIDPSNGDSTLIGNTNDGQSDIRLPSLAVHPTTGVMYAGGGSSNQNLYIVNPSNGDLTLVGATNVGNLVGLDFRVDGVLFASVAQQGSGDGGVELGIVNISNGDTTIVGSFGVTNLNSVAFFDGTLFGVGYLDELYEINTSNGVANLIQGVSPSIELGASQFACDGTYYVGRGAGDSGADGEFGTLDITDGDFTLILDTDLNETIGGFAFIQTCPSSIPIGGTVGSMDTVSLLVAGAQANMGWWSLALVGLVAAGAVITYKLKSNKTDKETQ